MPSGSGKMPAARQKNFRGKGRENPWAPRVFPAASSEENGGEKRKIKNWKKALDKWGGLSYNKLRCLRDATARPTKQHDGSIAQLGEHMPYKHGVTGSSPVVPTTSLGAVVQLVRTPACHAGGRGFKSLPRRQGVRTRAPICPGSSVGRAAD